MCVCTNLIFTMSWLLAQIFLTMITSNIHLLEAMNVKMLPSALVIGTVYCDTCFQENFSNTSHFISGALVAVECSATSSRPSFREEVKTDKNGKFEVKLPFSATKQAKKIKECTAKLITSNQPNCAVASTATSSSLQLKSRNPSTHIFSAGNLSFKPLKKPNLCNQAPTKTESFSKKLDSSESSNSPVQDPQSSKSFPPWDQKYLPSLPPLPRLPPLPQLPPFPGFPFFHPVPRRNRPIFPPNPFQTPPPSDYNSVPFPGLSPPPPPSEYETPIPPFPFQPSIDFPGIPSPKSSLKKKKEKTFP